MKKYMKYLLPLVVILVLGLGYLLFPTPTLNIDTSEEVRIEVFDNCQNIYYDYSNDLSSGEKVKVESDLNCEEVGTYEIKYKVSNWLKGRTYVQKVVIEDTTAPTITYHGDLQITCLIKPSEESCQFEYPEPKVGDAYDKDVELILDGEVDPSKVGDYTLKYTATDDSGNTSELEVEVRVRIDNNYYPENTRVMVAVNVLNVREEATTSSEVISKVYFGQEFKIIDQVIVPGSAGDDRLWLKIKKDDGFGWIAAWFVIDSKDKDDYYYQSAFKEGDTISGNTVVYSSTNPFYGISLELEVEREIEFAGTDQDAGWAIMVDDFFDKKLVWPLENTDIIVININWARLKLGNSSDELKEKYQAINPNESFKAYVTTCTMTAFHYSEVYFECEITDLD